MSKERRTKTQMIEEVILDLRRVEQALQLHSSELEASLGVTGPQLWAIWVLGMEGSLSLKDLAARIFLHPSTVVGVVDRLIEKGYVVRMADEGDRRRVRISLSRQGALLRRKITHPVHDRLLEGLRSLKADQVASFHGILGDLLDRMAKPA